MPSSASERPNRVPRDGARTRAKILDAGFAEFTANGFAGARVDAVAERAGVNIRALYAHFTNKEGLYEAVYGDRFAGKHDGVLQAIQDVVEDPDAAERLLPAIHRHLGGDTAFTRLMAWDALGANGSDPAGHIVAADVRAPYYASEIELLRTAQRASGLWRGLDPDLLLVAFMGLALYPHITWPLTKVLTGATTEVPGFWDRWDAFLQQLGEILAAGPPAPTGVAALPGDSTDANRLLRIGARALARAGLVTAYGHCSVRLDESTCLVTAPMPLGLITVERGSIIPIDGPLPEGVLGEVRIHQAIYRARADVNAVARVLPPSVKALSALGETARPLDGFGAYFAPSPPLWNDARLVRQDDEAAQLTDVLGDAPAVVLRGNGAVTVGESLPHAVVLARYLEDASSLDLAVRSSGCDEVQLTTEEVDARRTWDGGIVERMWAYLTHGDPELDGPL